MKHNFTEKDQKIFDANRRNNLRRQAKIAFEKKVIEKLNIGITEAYDTCAYFLKKVADLKSIKIAEKENVLSEDFKKFVQWLQFKPGVSFTLNSFKLELCYEANVIEFVEGKEGEHHQKEILKFYGIISDVREPEKFKNDLEFWLKTNSVRYDFSEYKKAQEIKEMLITNLALRSRTIQALENKFMPEELL